jgi:ATP-dependent Clp protease ATP-binding subunit ClpC
VVVLSQEEARRCHHNYIGTEHLLLALVSEGQGVAARVLESLGVSLEVARIKVEEIIGVGDSEPCVHIPFTPRAKKVLEMSLREALQLGHNYIGGEHLLLGLLREADGVASQVLVQLGVSLDATRSRVLAELAGSESAEWTPGGREAAESPPDAKQMLIESLSNEIRILRFEIDRLRKLLRRVGEDPGTATKS